MASHRISDETILVLSLTWHPSTANVIGVTLSNGDVCICTSTAEDPWGPNSLVTSRTLKQHSEEAWCMSFSHPNGDSDVLSGGDDAVLARISLAEDDQEAVPRWEDRKTHLAGVTAIIPLNEDLVVTGSYDDHIRLLHAPPIGRRQVLAETNLGGGVWRLKVLDLKTASSMTRYVPIFPIRKSNN